jgi:hypothetical protein
MRIFLLLLPLITALAALAFRNRLWALCLFFSYLTFEGILKLLSGYHPVVHIGADIVLWTMVGYWILHAVLRHEAAVPRVPMFTVLVLHTAWIILLVFSPYTANLFVGVASLKIHLSMIPLYFLGFAIAEDRTAPRWFMYVLCAVWTGTFAVTVLQYIGGPNSLFDLGAIYMTRLAGFHEWRPFGTTALPGGQAVFAFLALPFALALVLRGDYRLGHPLVLAVIVSSLATFFVSGVRQLFLGSLIIVIVMVGLQVMTGRARAIGALVTVIMIGSVTFVGIREFAVPRAQQALADAVDTPEIWMERNVVDRFLTLFELGTYRAARSEGVALVWDRVTAYPFGAGLGRTGSAAGALQEQLTQDPMGRMIQEQYGFQDNFFAAMLVETGIPGTVMLTSMLVAFIIISIRLALRGVQQTDRGLGALSAGYLVAMLVMSWGSQPLMSNPTLAFFWFLAGLTCGRWLRQTSAAESTDTHAAEHFAGAVA